jgi:hypothetical protein
VKTALAWPEVKCGLSEGFEDLNNVHMKLLFQFHTPTTRNCIKFPGEIHITERLFEHCKPTGEFFSFLSTFLKTAASADS